MSKVCEVCGKGHMKGNTVCFSNKKSPKSYKANIQTATLTVDGKEKKVKACTQCIKTNKKAK